MRARAASFVLALAGLVLLASPAEARKKKAPSGIGIGVAIGDPTAFTMKFLLSGNSAFDLMIGEDADGFDDLQINFDWLYSPLVLGNGPGFTVPFYFGVGGVLEFDDNDFNDDVDLGLRLPIGIAFEFQKAPIELFLEAAFEIFFINDDNDDLDVDALLGFRYYF